MRVNIFSNEIRSVLPRFTVDFHKALPMGTDQTVSQHIWLALQPITTMKHVQMYAYLKKERERKMHVVEKCQQTKECVD